MDPNKVQITRKKLNSNFAQKLSVVILTFQNISKNFSWSKFMEKPLAIKTYVENANLNELL